MKKTVAALLAIAFATPAPAQTPGEIVTMQRIAGDHVTIARQADKIAELTAKVKELEEQNTKRKAEDNVPAAGAGADKNKFGAPKK